MTLITAVQNLFKTALKIIDTEIVKLSYLPILATVRLWVPWGRKLQYLDEFLGHQIDIREATPFLSSWFRLHYNALSILVQGRAYRNILSPWNKFPYYALRKSEKVKESLYVLWALFASVLVQAYVISLTIVLIILGLLFWFGASLNLNNPTDFGLSPHSNDAFNVNNP